MTIEADNRFEFYEPVVNIKDFKMQKHLKRIFFACLSSYFMLHFFILTVQAEIVTDQSFGNEQSIQAENNTYQIDADSGYQNGQNLYHSFKTFNLDKGMTAHFTGPSTIQCIISRVTGGEMSHINGTIKSSIRGADFFLLNPSGVLFGESAQLDIDGSFFVSTADYLQMSESEKFMTGAADSSGLVTSSPISFGFLDEKIAPIKFSGSKAIHQEDSAEISQEYIDINAKYPIDKKLNVSGIHDFCIIGGQISIEKGVHIGINDNASQIQEGSTNNRKGTIRLISIKSQSDVYLKDMIDFSPDTRFDNISIKGSILNVSGQTVGGIQIFGNDIIAENSIFCMNNFGEHNAEAINLAGNNIKFLYQSKIISNTYAQGDAASIILTAKSDIQFIEHYSSIYSFSGSYFIKDSKITGNTSTMSILANNFYLNDGARIINRTHSSGNCSDISIEANETIRLSCKNNRHYESSIFFDTYKTGNAGTIKLKAKLIEFSDGVKLSVSTKSTGQGGSIIITAEDLHLNGIRHHNNVDPIQGCRIFLRSYGKQSNAGASGNLLIHANNIIFADGAQIKAQTYGYGKGGDLTLIATESIVLKGHDGTGKSSMINASCDQLLLDSGIEQSGNITIQSKNIELKDGAWISTQTQGKGDAGTIKITAYQKLELSGESLSIYNVDKETLSSCILSSAKPKSKGNGGTIKINSNEMLLLNGAFIATGTESSGNAGEIDIQAKTITLMGISTDHKSSMIKSNTLAEKFAPNTHVSGDGGTVTINANNVNLFDGARITTSSIAKIESSGKAGDIHLNLNGTLRISGKNNNEIDVDGQSSGIYARSKLENQAHSGEAGRIDILSNNLVMDNDGLISTSSNGQSSAGDINIQTKQSILLTNSSIASENKMPVTEDQNGGSAGSIRIDAGGDIQLFQSAHITTNAVSSGGGKIDIQNNNALTIINSNITTNVHQGEGNGGDINIRTDLTVLNHGIISANADAGDGGAIYIYTRNMIQSPDSRIEATSERGNDGTVEIETPDVGDIQGLLNLSDNFLESSNIVNTLCDANAKDSIRLVINSPFIPHLSASWYRFSDNTPIRLLSTNITDQFDNFSEDFSDDALYPVE